MQAFFKRTSSNASSEISNIFRMGKKKDYLSYLNLLYTDMFYERSKNNTITKMFFDNHKFDWELYIMLTLDTIGLGIYPNVLNVSYQKTS